MPRLRPVSRHLGPVQRRSRKLHLLALAISTLAGCLWIATGHAQRAPERPQRRLESAPRLAEASRAVPSGRVDLRTGATRSRFAFEAAVPRGAPEQMARSFLRARGADFGLSLADTDLELLTVREGLGTRHVRFRQTYRGIPVFGSDVVVSLHEGRGTVTAVTSEYKPRIVLPTITPVYSEASAALMALAHLAPPDPPAWGPETELMVHSREGVHRLAYRVAVVLAEPLGDWEVFVDAITGGVISVRDRMCYVHGSGRIFNPDPISSSGSPYGTPGLVDGGDANTPELDAERKWMPLYDIAQVGPDFQLSGPATTIFDFPGALGAPFGDTPAAYQQADPHGFDYTRDQQGFEAVMVYGHITNLQAWIQLIGFNNVNNEVDPVDPHAISGASNAFYSPSVDAMAFGEGDAHPTRKVDTAEDAGVIAHEYGHAIQENQVPGWGVFVEGGAMGEGFGDYLAGSYVGWESTFLRDWVGKWFMTGTGNGLRPLNSTKTYPGDLVHQVHADGEIWSACLWLIHDALGRVLTDKIVIQSHFYLTPGATFRDGALAILQADADITGGANAVFLNGVFTARGILQPLPFTVANAASNEVAPTVSYDRDSYDDWGRHLLTAWVDDSYGLPGQTEARLMHASGGFTAAEFLVGDITDPDAGFAPLQDFPNGPGDSPPLPRYLVVGATPGLDQNVHGFLLDADDGTVTGPLVIAATAASEVRPAVAAVDTTYLVAWINDDGTGAPFVEAQRVEDDGTLLGGPISFAAPPFPMLQGDLDVGAGFTPGPAFTVVGQFLVAWWQFFPGIPPDVPAFNYIRAARVTRTGDVLDAVPIDVAAAEPATAMYSTPAVAFDGTNYCVAWREHHPMVGTSEIWGRMVNAVDGTLGGAFLIGPDPADRNPDVAFAGSQYLVVWSTAPFMPGDTPNVLGRRFTPSLGYMDAVPLAIAATGLQEKFPRVTQVGGQDSWNKGQSFYVSWTESPVDPENWDIRGTFVREVPLTAFPPPAPLTVGVGIAGPPDASGASSTVVPLPFNVTNTGTRRDGYRLRVLQTQSPPWPAAADQDIVVLDPAATGPVTVSVTIPGTAGSGTTNTVSLVARSTSDSTVTATDPVVVTSMGPVGVGDDIPAIAFGLGRLAPNPFGERTQFEITLPRSADVHLEVFDVSGQRVRTLRSGRFEPGRYAVVWDGRDGRGAQLPVGVYFVRLRDGAQEATRRVVRMR